MGEPLIKSHRRRATDHIVDLMTHEAAYVSPVALAEYYGVGVRKIYQDIDKGAIEEVIRVGPGGPLRIPIDAARRYGKPIL